MKNKALAIFLVTFFAFVVTACGASSESSSSASSKDNNVIGVEKQEEEVSESVGFDSAIAEAEALDWRAVYKDISDNAARAEDYLDKWYAYTGEIQSIEKTYCVLEDIADVSKTIKVYLDTPTLKLLNKGETLNVLGKFSKLSASSSCEMKTALVISNDQLAEHCEMGLVSESGTYGDAQYSDYTFDKGIGQITSYYVKGDAIATNMGTHELSYDAAGNLVKDVCSSPSGKTKTYTYTYSADGTIEKEVQDDRAFDITCEKDSNGNITKKTLVNTDSGYTLVFQYTYNADGTIATEKQTSDSSTYDITYGYDDFGNVILKSSKSSESTSTTKYTYRIVGVK